MKEFRSRKNENNNVVEEVEVTDISTEETETMEVPEVLEVPVSKTDEFTVTAERLNVRAANSTTSDILKVVTKGDKLYGNKVGEWIELNDGGYVMSQYVE